MNQIVNMIMRIFLRKIISKGMDKGFDMAAGGRKKRAGGAGNQKASGHGVSEEDRAEMASMKQSQKRAKQAMRVGKRIGRL